MLLSHITKITKQPSLVPLEPSLIETLNISQQEKLNLISKEQSKFIDVDYLPMRESLGNYEEVKEIAVQSQRQNDENIGVMKQNITEEHIIWRRLSDIFPQLMQNGKQLFDENIKVEDIKDSGLLQNRSFVQAVKQLFEKSPSLIRQNFITQQVSEDGLYQFRFYINGEPKIITVDDYLPFFHDKMLSSTINIKPQIQWLALIEKAWAKLCGSYEKISNLHTLEVLKYFTNCPNKLLHHDLIEPEEIWRNIEENIKNKGLIFASSGVEKSMNEQHSQGAHILAINDAFQFTLPNTDQKVRILKMKDLNNITEWLGDWGEKSDKWEIRNNGEELKKLLSYDQVYQSGQFYISFDDYINFYNSTCLLKVHFSKHYPFIRENLRLSHVQGSFALAKFQIHQKVNKLYLTLHQVAKRLATHDVSYEFSKARIIVGRTINQTTQDYIKCIHGTQEELVVELSDIVFGNYIVYIEVEWVMPEITSTFVLSAYADQPIGLEAADKNEYQVQDPQNQVSKYIILDQLMKSSAIKNEKKRTYFENQKGDVKSLFKVISMTDGQGGDIGYIYYSNFRQENQNSTLPHLHEKLIFKDIKNLKIQGLNEETLEIDINLKPDQDLLYLIRRVGPSTETCSYKLANYTRLSYNTEISVDEFRERAKKTQIIDESNNKNNPYNQYVYVLQHEDGFGFLFDNQEQDKVLMIKIQLNTENLKEKTFYNPKPSSEDTYIESSNDLSEVQEGIEKMMSQSVPNEWKLKIEPNSYNIKQLSIVDITKKTSFKYSLIFKVLNSVPERDQDLLIQQIQTQGQRTQIEAEGKKYDIFVYNCLIDSKQYWYFENREKDRDFQGTYTFQLTNLEDDQGRSEVAWDIRLNPKSFNEGSSGRNSQISSALEFNDENISLNFQQNSIQNTGINTQQYPSILKALHVVDPFVKCGISYSTSYTVRQI
eukprot:403365197